MTQGSTFTQYDDLGEPVRKALLEIKEFVGNLDGKTIALHADEGSFIDGGDVDSEDAVKAFNVIVEALRATAAPPQPASDDVAGAKVDIHDIIVRARQTQCCDPIIDGVLASLIKECEDLRSRIEALTADRDGEPK